MFKNILPVDLNKSTGSILNLPLKNNMFKLILKLIFEILLCIGTFYILFKVIVF